MNAFEWVSSLTDEQRETLATMDESEVMGYLADQGLELPDEMLEGVTGGINVWKTLGHIISDFLAKR